MRDERQLQITSTWLNMIAASIVSGGTVSQLVAIASGASVEISLGLILLCIMAGAGLHLAPLRFLRSTSDHQ